MLLVILIYDANDKSYSMSKKRGAVFTAPRFKIILLLCLESHRTDNTQGKSHHNKYG